MVTDTNKPKQKRDSAGRFLPLPEVPDLRPKFIREGSSNSIDGSYGMQFRSSKTGQFVRSDAQFDTFRIKYKAREPTGEYYQRGNAKRGIKKGDPKYKTVTKYTDWQKVELRKPKDKSEYHQYRIVTKVPTGTIKRGKNKGKTRYRNVRSEWQDVITQDKGKKVNYNDVARALYLRTSADKPASAIKPTSTVSRDLVPSAQSDVNFQPFFYIVSGDGYYEGEEDKIKSRTMRVWADHEMSYEELWEIFGQTHKRVSSDPTSRYHAKRSTFKVQQAYKVTA